MSGEKLSKAKKWGIFLSFAVLLLGAAAAAGYYEYHRVCHICSREAGVAVSAADFLKNKDDRGYFTIDSDVIDESVPGEYHLLLKTDWFVHNCKLTITDTIPPEGKARTVSTEINQECDAAEFVENITDATKVTVSYVEKPDFSRGGRQDVTVLLTDAGGNTAEVASELFISQVVEELYVEAGGDIPELSDFVIEGETAEFKTAMEAIDYEKPSEKTIEIMVDGLTYQSRLYIVDTTPPIVSLHDISGYTRIPRKPEDFVTSVEDVTEVKSYFVEEPDLFLTGEQEVQIGFIDEGENEVIKTARLTLEEDTQAPVIEGARDLDVIIGNTISYKKNVEATDNCPEGLEFSVDSSAVNLSQEGTYPVIYTATDYAGNTSSVEVTVTVRPRVYDINEVNAMADAVLAGILTEGMSPVEKVQAIYNYVTRHISYISDSDKSNPVRAAYEGFNDRKGDCFVYAATSKFLLTRAGIPNMDIEKIPARTLHYWNLVDLGEGWLHFDTTPRKDHPVIFLWTDAQLMDYSARHYNSHNYDHEAYPVVN